MSATNDSLVLGKYEVIKRVAVGGMAELFLARQRGVAGFDRFVILKQLLPDLASNPSSVRQFLDEARVASILGHPNIVSIYEVGEAGDGYFIAMELIRGITVSAMLAEARDRNAPIPLGVAAHVIREAASGLAFAHSAKDPDGRALNVVHRDVSPSNLMIDEHGSVKIVDFGIARADNRLTKTRSGTVKGKWSYMPIEQLSGGKLDGRADQYALGVVFWELVTGRRLFSGDNMVELVQERDVPSPSIFRDVDSELERVILKTLSATPEDRFESCDVLVAALDAWAEAHPAEDCSSAAVRARTRDLVARATAELVGSHDGEARPSLSPAAHPPTVRLGEPARFPEPSGALRRRWPWLAGFAAALLLVGVGAWATRGPAPSVPVEVPPAQEVVAPAQKVVTPEAALPAPAAVNPPTAPSTVTEPVVEAPKPKRRNTVRRENSGHGWLNVDTVPWSEVWVDGRFIGTTPIYKKKLTSGSHRIRFVNEKLGLRKTKKIRVSKNQSLKLVEKLD